MSGPPAEFGNSSHGPNPDEDYQLAQRAEADDEPELVLAPPEGKSSAEILAEIEAQRRPRVSDYLQRTPPAAPPLLPVKFSLADLFIVVTCCALGLAGATWVQPEIYAGALGLGALVVIPAFYLAGADAHWIRRVWLVTLTVYFTACIAAILRMTLTPGM